MEISPGGKKKLEKKWWQWNDLGKLETSRMETFLWTVITVFGIM